MRVEESLVHELHTAQANLDRFVKGVIAFRDLDFVWQRLRRALQPREPEDRWDQLGEIERYHDEISLKSPSCDALEGEIPDAGVFIAALRRAQGVMKAVRENPPDDPDALPDEIAELRKCSEQMISAATEIYKSCGAKAELELEHVGRCVNQILGRLPPRPIQEQSEQPLEPVSLQAPVAEISPVLSVPTGSDVGAPGNPVTAPSSAPERGG